MQTLPGTLHHVQVIPVVQFTHCYKHALYSYRAANPFTVISTLLHMININTLLYIFLPDTTGKIFVLKGREPDLQCLFQL